MNRAMPAKQRGLSFSGFIFGAFLLVMVSIVGLKLIPAYIENATIKNLFVAVANDPEMKGASVGNIKMSFIRRASIENVRAITAEDIAIDKADGSLTLSASYAVKVPLVANISLYLEFNPTSGE
ncbi:MAG: DUF4845 domain-containing protein [Gallionellales bacterium GWA2_59_43]|nr:MAG: DUF4845 domain-containing protein [Gallionellales bacterium GWA2_59_43]